MEVNSLPNNKMIDWFNFKAFADDNFNVIEMSKFFIDRIENIAGKGENDSNQHFLLCLQCFQKASFSGPLKGWIV